jgi:hypothetical protein
MTSADAQLSAIMRKTGTASDEGRRKNLIRRTNAQSIPAQRWPTALIVCPTSLVDNVSTPLGHQLTASGAESSRLCGS